MQSEPLPKWIMKRYALLWKLIKEESFTLKKAADFIKEDEKIMAVLLSRLIKAGWVDVQFDQEDRRKRIYHLKNPQKVIEVMQNEN